MTGLQEIETEMTNKERMMKMRIGRGDNDDDDEEVNHDKKEIQVV